MSLPMTGTTGCSRSVRVGIVLLVAALPGLAPALAQRVGPPPSREAAQYSFASVVKKAAPAVVNGMVYVASGDGKLYAFGLP